MSPAANSTKKKRSKSRSRRRRRARWKRLFHIEAEFVTRLVASTLAGIGVFMSFPNFTGVEVFPVLWVALIPMLWAMDSPSWKAAFGWAWWTGFITNTGGFYWLDYMLQEFGHLPPPASVPLTLLITAYQGLVFGLFGIVAHALRTRARIPLALAAPMGIVVAEMFVPLIFPWYLANGQYQFTWVSQFMDITGVVGLSFFIVYTNAALYEWFMALRHGNTIDRRHLAAFATAWIVILGYGAWRTATVDAASAAAPKVRVALVEADVGIWEKAAKSLPRNRRAAQLMFNLIKHQRLSAQAVEDGAELVVWSESSYLPLGDLYLKRSDVFAVAAGAGGGVQLFDNGEWKAPAEVLPAGYADIQWSAVWARNEAETYLGGADGRVVRFDGRHFSPVQTELQGSVVGITGRPDGRGLWLATSQGDVVRVSESGSAEVVASAAGQQIVALTYDRRAKRPLAVTRSGQVGTPGPADTWSWTAAVDDGTINGAWVSPGGTAVLVGDSGLVAWRRSGKWTTESLRGAGALHGVWGERLGRIWVVGDGGVVRYHDGRSWSAVDSPTRADWRAVGGVRGGRVYVVGRGGEALVRNVDGQWVPGQAGGSTLVSLTGLDYFRQDWIPTDVRWFYRSPHALPKGMDPGEIYAAERDLPWGDRTSLQRGFKAPLLFGAILREPSADGGEGRVFNTALLVDERGRVQGRYDKNYLLVFGEYIPGGETFPQFYEWLPEASHFTAGQTVESFEFRDHRIGVMICYEDILPRFTRRLSGKGSEFMVNVTNDAWFGKTAEPYLHLDLALARTIENRQWLARATNTGVSAFVDAAGRLRGQTSLEGEEYLIDDVPMLQMATVYQAVGDAFGWGCVLFSIAALALRGRTRRRR